MRKLFRAWILILVFTLASPLFIYWWGLSNLPNGLVNSSTQLTTLQQKQIWKDNWGQGVPRIKRINPYGFIFYLHCGVYHDPRSIKCQNEYPGITIASLAIQQQVFEQTVGYTAFTRQITWASYTIWVARNWNIQQVLSEYHH